MKNMQAIILSAVLFSIPGAGKDLPPVSHDQVLIFVQPFENLSPRAYQPWLSNGLPGFVDNGIDQSSTLEIYRITPKDVGLLDRPHRLERLIWKEVFDLPVDNRYETYLLIGNYSYIDGELEIRMELMSLRDTRTLARYAKTFEYTKLLAQKDALGKWVHDQITLPGQERSVSEAVSSQPNRLGSLPGIAKRKRPALHAERGQAAIEQELPPVYAKQEAQQLGTQVEKLWQDIAYDPYLAEIQDLKTLRLQAEPDSVLVTFNVAYRVNPRILDEIEHFSRTRADQVESSSSFQGHTFMDLGYIDEDFVHSIAAGDWRMVPIISMGPKGFKGRRVFYHSFPRPLEPPSVRHINQGQFEQLLLAVPGVNSMRIFAREASSIYPYEIIVGLNELKGLDKIQVKFVAEQDLKANL